MFIGSEWGTVCDDSFRNIDAMVVCKQLGYYGGQAVYHTYGTGTGTILMDDVNCNSSSTNLFNCPYTASQQANCIHYEDVGVRCSTVVPLPLGQVTGPVVVGVNGTVGPVCPHPLAGTGSFGSNDAEVVCRELGLSGGTAPPVPTVSTTPAPSNTHFYPQPRCTGTEMTLAACPSAGVSRHGQCNHNQPARVSCAQSVRLCVGTDCSSQHTAGRVEVLSGGTWGTVCDDYWSTVNSQVVCAQLGFTNGTTQLNLGATSFHTGATSQPIALDDVQCDGGETSILTCSARVNSNNCRHSEDVGVICSATTRPPNGGPTMTFAPVGPPSSAAPVRPPTTAPTLHPPTYAPVPNWQAAPTAAVTPPPSAPTSPSKSTSGSGPSNNMAVIGGSALLALVVVGFVFYCWRRNRSGSGGLPRTYMRVQHEGRPDATSDDDDDDDLIISDVQGVIDGSLDLQGHRDSVDLYDTPDPLEPTYDSASAEPSMFDDDGFNPRAQEATYDNATEVRPD